MLAIDQAHVMKKAIRKPIRRLRHEKRLASVVSRTDSINTMEKLSTKSIGSMSLSISQVAKIV